MRRVEEGFSVIVSDALLREIVILEDRLYKAQVALKNIGLILHIDVAAGSVSAMKASLALRSAKKQGSPAEPELPF